MQSKRDQVQAHSFIMGRLTSGMLLADPDAPESPLGRTTRGALIGVVIGVLVAAGSVVYGLIAPGGNDSWRSGQTLVVNRDTGARYLYIGDRLRPVRNYSSALLIGGNSLKTTDVRTKSLSGTPVGAAVGITGAPDSVPAKGDLETGPWQVCSALSEVDGAAAAVTALVAGAPASGTAVGTGKALVVSGPDQQTYLVWQGSRLKLDKNSGAAVSLGYGSVAPRPVSAAFLDALVAGPDLATPVVPDQGTKGPSLGGRAGTVGQVFQVRVPGSGTQYYLLRAEGLVPLTATATALVLGDPTTRAKAYGGASPTAAVIGADVLKDHLVSGTAGQDPSVTGLPDSPPRTVGVPDGWTACARVQPGDSGTRVTTALVPAAALAPVTQSASDGVAAACLRVDAVVVRPGHGALVRALGAGGTTVGNTTYLVGDDGVKYRVTSKAALEALGYAGAAIPALPSPLLSMLPSGPDLSPEAASGAGGAPVTAPACATGAQRSGTAAGTGGRGGPGTAQESTKLPSG